jgi:transcription elongation GreA/GreB family factor
MKDGDDLPEVRAHIERTEPYPLSASGRANLERTWAEATDPQERARLERALELAIVPLAPADQETIAFGAHVTVDAVDMTRSTFAIVGDNEADIPAGKVGISSPLAQALIGKRVGAKALWRRPAGDRNLRVRAVSYPDANPPLLDSETGSGRRLTLAKSTSIT